METKRYIGIDLHRNCFTACVRLENGREYLKEWQLEDLSKFTRTLRATDQIAVEVTGNTRLLHDAVSPHVERVAVVNPNQFKVITHSVKKTDPNKSIAELEETIAKEGQNLQGHANLTSIKGIGGLSGSILLSIIGDIHDFPEEGNLAAYFGIVPRISNSNETEHSGRITKRGTKLGRTTLIQCALIAQRYSPYLKKYYEKMKSRRGTGKAIVALARKFLGIIYRTLKNNWVFEDFPNFVLAAEKARA